VKHHRSITGTSSIQQLTAQSIAMAIKGIGNKGICRLLDLMLATL